MKNNLILVLFFIFPVWIFSEDSQFAIPQRIEPIGVYTKVRVDGGVSEKRDSKVYQREKQGYIEGELKFLSYFSIKLGTTKTQWEKTDTKTLTELDRFNIGLKFAKEHVFSFGTFAWGGGSRIFDKQNPKFARDNVAPDLYLVRSHINFGLKISSFEIITNFQFQSEANRAFKENQEQEFRRHMQLGVSVSYNFTENFRGFLETEYRKPYMTKTDFREKFWNIYPGVAYQIYKGGFLGFSLQFPLIPEREHDRGFRLSYYHVF